MDDGKKPPVKKYRVGDLVRLRDRTWVGEYFTLGPVPEPGDERERLALANEMRDYVGKFYSVNYIRKNVLKQNDREIEQMDNQIRKEIDDGIIQSPMAQVSEEKK